MTASDARTLLEHIGDRPLAEGDAVFLDTVRARISRRADLTPRQSRWLQRIATETTPQVIAQ